MKIGVDIISGESDIRDLIKGCVDAVSEDPSIEVVMVGKGDVYRSILMHPFYKNNKNLKRISIIEASEVVTMADDPISVVKKKKDSSVIKGLQAHKMKEINAFFSPGNTGAIVVAASLILGRVRGVKKPALIALMPNTEGKANILLDVGASAECEVEDLLKFAVMGRLYAQEMLGIENPRIGLLNIGEESHKGTSAIKETYKRLLELNINFKGNVEGYQIFSNEVEVIICDGYIGNIALKCIEGAASTISKLLRKAIFNHIPALLTLPFYAGALKELMKKADPEEYGGVPLLGVNGNVFIGHGKSGRSAIKYGIKAAANAVRHDILGKLHKKLGELHLDRA